MDGLKVFEIRYRRQIIEGATVFVEAATPDEAMQHLSRVLSQDGIDPATLEPEEVLGQRFELRGECNQVPDFSILDQTGG